MPTTLLDAGVCMRVPFNRVTIKPAEVGAVQMDTIDFGGVSYETNDNVSLLHVQLHVLICNDVHVLYGSTFYSVHVHVVSYSV